MAPEIDVISSSLQQLESASRNQVTVSALHGGWFTLPVNLFVAGAAAEDRSFVPSLAFLITHETVGKHKKHILFDLGLRRDTTSLLPQIQEHLLSRQPMSVLPDVCGNLTTAGLAAEKIDQVILSHVHWDHIGTPSDYAKAQMFVGFGSLHLLESGLNGHMSHSHFQHDLFDNLDVQQFPDPEAFSGVEAAHPWQTLGGLSLLDIFSDGCMYVINLPGHLPGHIGVLARLGSRRWVILAGDACHDFRLLYGGREIAEWKDTAGNVCCIHTDKAEATKTLEVLRAWKQASSGCGLDLDIIFAHDVGWAKTNATAFLPGQLV
jgi:glyoxylase-like metal-dependent hydrolase (beta-lactamase superfamily II)